METALTYILSIEGLIVALLIAALGDKLKVGLNFILRLLRCKPLNGGPNWITLDSYNNRRPDWFVDWEKRHDKTHDKIGSSISEVKDEVKKVSDKLETMAEAVIRIDERTKKPNE